jgi:CHAD domain-containing protein
MYKERKIFLQAYYDRQLADVISCLEVIPGNYRVRDIHKMRVRIKRLRAVFRLLEYCNPEEFRAKDLYRPYKAVFKGVGKVRERQINSGLFREYPLAGSLRRSYYRYINIMMQRWSPGLDALIQSFDYAAIEDASRKIESYLSGCSEPELTRVADEFINSEILRINKLLKEEDDLHYIHEVRIILKNIKPLLGLLRRRRHSDLTGEHYDRIVETEKLIGSWHDRHVFSQSLKMFFNSFEGGKEMFFDFIQGDKELSSGSGKNARELSSGSIEKGKMLPPGSGENVKELSPDSLERRKKLLFNSMERNKEVLRDEYIALQKALADYEGRTIRQILTILDHTLGLF